MSSLDSWPDWEEQLSMIRQPRKSQSESQIPALVSQLKLTIHLPLFEHPQQVACRSFKCLSLLLLLLSLLLSVKSSSWPVKESQLLVTQFDCYRTSGSDMTNGLNCTNFGQHLLLFSYLFSSLTKLDSLEVSQE